VIRFVIVCAGLVVLALLFALPPFLRRPREPSDTDRREMNLDIYREQMRELNRDLAAGTLSRAQWQQDRDELSHRMLEDVKPGGEATPSVSGGWSRMAPAVAIAALVPIAAAVLYTVVGTPGALDPATAKPKVGPHAGGKFTPEQVDEMLLQLAQRMEKEPDNLEGWVLLGRSYAALGRFPEAAAALRQAVRLKGDDPGLLTDYADVLAMANGQNLEGEPLKLIEKALAIDPNHQKGLALAGTAAFDRGDFAGAVKQWERLLKTVPADSEGARSIQASIEDARAQAGKPLQKNAEFAQVSGTVSLAPELSAKASPDDTLFVLATASNGPPMPLALQKLRAADLPAKFNLDDSMSTAPALKISRFQEVVVTARITKSGQAGPRAGDLEGSVGPVKVGSPDLAIVIDKVRP